MSNVGRMKKVAAAAALVVGFAGTLATPAVAAHSADHTVSSLLSAAAKQKNWTNEKLRVLVASRAARDGFVSEMQGSKVVIVQNGVTRCLTVNSRGKVVRCTYKAPAPVATPTPSPESTDTIFPAR